ncbi:MAG: hypothetical protein K1X64_00905 [Myxococcaceae bacterium]|nr:hypothetical protein [Myxococcaceae bacterium]
MASRTTGLTLCCVVVSLTLSGCGHNRVALTKVLPNQVQSPVEPAAMHDAVIRALSRHGWGVEKDSPQSVTARQLSKGASVEIAVDMNGDSFTIRYLESNGLNEKTENGEVVEISPLYSRWVSILSKSIRDEVDRPAREAAVAAKEDAELAKMRAQADARLIRSFVLARETPLPVLREAIINAFREHGYDAQSEVEGKLVGRYARRGETLRVAVEYSSKQFTIRYLESDGLGAKTDKNGVTDIGSVYDRWTANLAETIQRKL